MKNKYHTTQRVSFLCYVAVFVEGKENSFRNINFLFSKNITQHDL